MKEKLLNKTPIHYWTNDVQSEKCIIFIHPAFVDHTCFDMQLDYFNKYKIITIDLIGHGKSIGKGTIEDTSSYIKKIMEIENIPKINLVGVSIGAILVQDFANKYPDLVSSLTCIGGYDINNFTKELQKDNGNNQMEMMIKGMFSIKKFAEDNKRISAYTDEAKKLFYELNLKFRKSSFRYLANLGKMINKYETKDRTYPLLIGVGKYDNEMGIKASKIWHTSEPESEYVEFDNAGHIVNMDNPEQFNKILEKLIKD